MPRTIGFSAKELAMKRTLLRTAVAAATMTSLQAGAQITFYEHDGYRGNVFTTDKAESNFANRGFNDRASSVVVERGRWEVCENESYGGSCRVLRRGSYDSLRAMDLNDRISSVRRMANRGSFANEAPAPQSVPSYEYRRRPGEALFLVPVTSVRAVTGPPERRCWMERQEVEGSSRGEPSVGRGLAGALLGGVIGHQIGGGTGKDLATIGGAVAGGVIGANSGRGNPQTTQRDVQRCEDRPSSTPAYWDVGYSFRGVNHQVQLSAEPGRDIEVNGRGEPRQ